MKKINLTALKPNKVSTDPTSYSLWLAGPPKIGKSTFIHELFGERTLFIATEKRFGALDGAYIQYVSNWSEFTSVMRELKKPEVKEMFDNIVIDTIDNLVKYCEDYVASVFDEEELGEGTVGFGKDFSRANNVWFKGLKLIESSGYTYCFISHVKQVPKKIAVKDLRDKDKKELHNASLVRDEQNEAFVEFNQYTQDMKEKYLIPTAKMIDNIVFAENTINSKQEDVRVLHLRESLQFKAGVTLKNVPRMIKFDTEEFKNVLDKSLNTSYENTTSERKSHSDIKDSTYNFDELMQKAKDLAKDFAVKGKVDKVHNLTEKILGKNQQIINLKENQVEVLAKFVGDLELLAKAELQTEV